jgi:hypothetical protein
VDIQDTIAPKSEQLDAVDLVSGRAHLHIASSRCPTTRPPPPSSRTKPCARSCRPSSSRGSPRKPSCPASTRSRAATRRISRSSPRSRPSRCWPRSTSDRTRRHETPLGPLPHRPPGCPVSAGLRGAGVRRRRQGARGRRARGGCGMSATDPGARGPTLSGSTVDETTERRHRRRSAPTDARFTAPACYSPPRLIQPEGRPIHVRLVLLPRVHRLPHAVIPQVHGPWPRPGLPQARGRAVALRDGRGRSSGDTFGRE